MWALELCLEVETGRTSEHQRCKHVSKSHKQRAESQDEGVEITSTVVGYLILLFNIIYY